jgi:hypothetical protein
MSYRSSSKHLRGSASAWAIIAAALLVCACTMDRKTGNDDTPGGAVALAPSTVNATTPPVDHEQTPRSDVVFKWRDNAKMKGTVFRSNELLASDLSNSLDREVKGRIVLVSSGLDGRVVERILEDFVLPARGSRELTVPIGKLPIQSEESTSFVAAVAEVQRPNGTLRISTAPLYYRFQNGYSEAAIYNADEAGKLADWGVKTKNPMVVQGRILDPDGRITDAAEAAARAAAEARLSGKGRQGVTMFGRSPVDAAAAKPALPRVPPILSQKAAAPKDPKLRSPDIETVVICTTWFVQYTDAEWGEDHFATSSWFHPPASHAEVSVVDESGANVLWSGHLNGSGCATVSLPVGLYYLVQTTDWAGPEELNGPIQKYVRTFYTGPDGHSSATTQLIEFEVFQGTTFVPLQGMWNDDAVQAAAVAGLVLDQYIRGQLSLANWHYVIRANKGCAELDPPTDSCYMDVARDPPSGSVHLGTTVIDGVPEAHWKYVIAHEFGHYAQDMAMGSHFFNYDDVATEDLCTCEHYDTSWGNQVHCIQSREEIGGAQLEGFAQAFASRTFNNVNDSDGTFVYYKPFLEVLDEWGHWYAPPVAFDIYSPAGNRTRWMEQYCSAEGKGVELDWATFYYQVTSHATANTTNMQTLFSIYRRACTGNPIIKCSFGQHIAWSNLESAAFAHYGSNPVNPSFVRFLNTGINTGVVH